MSLDLFRGLYDASGELDKGAHLELAGLVLALPRLKRAVQLKRALRARKPLAHKAHEGSK